MAALAAHGDEAAVERIREYAAHCAVDGDGMNVTWIENVDPRSSIRFLETLIDDTHHQAMAAIAAHGDEAGRDVLEKVARSDPSPGVRETALFGLALARGAEPEERVS